MPFRPPKPPPDFGRILQYLNNANISTKNNALYQTIKSLIEAIRDQVEVDEDTATGTATDITGLAALITQLIAAEYLTWSDQSGFLPNSRELIAGTGITFDDSVANERTIESTGSGTAYAPMSTGAEPLEIMSDGAGAVLMVGFTP